MCDEWFYKKVASKLLEGGVWLSPISLLLGDHPWLVSCGKT